MTHGGARRAIAALLLGAAWAVVAQAMPPAPPGPARVLREHGLIVIEARAAPRWQVAQQLAAVTGSTLQAPPQILAQARPLNLRWQGHDARAAWAAVLGQEVNHALACETGRCRVWLVPGVPAARHAAPAPPAQGGPVPDPPGLFPAD